MFVVICLDNSIPMVSCFEDELEALENVKYLAENGAINIRLTKNVEFEIERKVSVKLI
ncbi:hypothetical protein [Bacillus sp. JJ722]|uniref:hypothetical protein n=1 Tax=Bacillus sp. JJ722 TaxID=3122973 RepID=UPI002FFE8D28